MTMTELNNEDETWATRGPEDVLAGDLQSTNLQDVELSQEDSAPLTNVLSVVWSNGKLGAACYRLDTAELSLFPDTYEVAPVFETLRTIFKQTLPKVVLGCLRQDPRFLSVLKHLTGNSNFSSDNLTSCVEILSGTSPVGGIQKLSLFIEPGKEFAPDSCKRRIQEVRMPDEPKLSTELEHLVYITSLIPFANIGMVRAAGALLKFLDKRGIELLHLDLINGKAPVLGVNVCTTDDLVLVDHTAWDALQIFSLDSHPSAAKQGKSGSKEGLSVYGMCNKCLTSQGANFLRLQLLRPTRNMVILKRRHDVVEYCVSIAHTGFVESARSYLNSIKNLPKLLQRLSTLHTTVKEWKHLYQTLHNCILLGEVCATQPDSIELFKDIGAMCKENLTIASIIKEIQRVVDFDNSVLNQRFYPNTGINDRLDQKRQQYRTLPEVMSMIATEEMTRFPSYVKQCCAVYIPEVGYLLAVLMWGENLTMDELALDGLEFKFTNANLAYYKSKLTNELDAILGDAQIAILELETYVMITLTENIIKHSSVLVNVNALIAELDSLMSLAAVARDHRFFRPQIVSGNEKLKIVEGRHPLIELNSAFVPNSTNFEEEEKIVILTGPNASGKSIYLKQIGIIVILALAGSFVPSNLAIIPTFDRICTRISVVESVAEGLSTFLMDVNQMSLAHRSCTKTSLIIIDEFGKGTSETDGLCLLQASLEAFGQKGIDSPTIFLSSHFFSLYHRLPALPVFKAQKLDFFVEDDRIVYLFKLIDGVCSSSFSYMVAGDAGVPLDIIPRSILLANIHRGDDLLRLKPVDVNFEISKTLVAIAEDVFPLDDMDSKEYMEGVYHFLRDKLEVAYPKKSQKSPQGQPEEIQSGTRDMTLTESGSRLGSYTITPESEGGLPRFSKLGHLNLPNSPGTSSLTYDP